MLFNLRKSRELIIPSLLVALFIISISQPALGQTATIEVDPSTVTVTVCNNFDVDIWIRNIPIVMTEFYFTVTWDDTQMQLDSYDEHCTDNGWTTFNVIQGSSSLRLVASGSNYDQDASWITLTFHCIDAGSSSINLEDTGIYYLETALVDHTTVNGTVNQNSPPDPPGPDPPSYSGQVGGTIYSVNRLVVLAPFSVLIGLVGIIAIVFVVRRKYKV